MRVLRQTQRLSCAELGSRVLGCADNNSSTARVLSHDGCGNKGFGLYYSFVFFGRCAENASLLFPAHFSKTHSDCFQCGSPKRRTHEDCDIFHRFTKVIVIAVLALISPPVLVELCYKYTPVF